MKNSALKLQTGAVCLLGVLAVGAIIKNAHHFFSSDSRSSSDGRVLYQVDVLKQEAAFPGKIVRATAGGKELLHYICQPEDAAVAVVASREKSTGANIVPHIFNAYDESGRQYIAKLRVSGALSLITLQHGFAKRPKMVSLNFELGPISSSTSQFTIQFTKISEPHRIVQVPKTRNLPAVAIFDDRRGFLVIRPSTPGGPNEGLDPHLLATSFGAGIPLGQGLPYLSFLFPEYTGIDIDAVRVQLDRMRYVESTVVLTYSGARIADTGGVRFIQFPTREKVGSVLDFDAYMGPVLKGNGPKSVAPPSDQMGQAYVRIAPKDSSVIPPAPGMPGYSPPPILQLLDVTPGPDQLGFASLKVRLLDPTSIGAANSGFDEEIRAKQTVNRTAEGLIPSFIIRIRVKKPVKISSTVVDLPVTHIIG